MSQILDLNTGGGGGSPTGSAGGELAGTYPNPTLLNSAVVAKVLTGLSVAGSSVLATDTILQAFGKVQSQINALVGGVVYVSSWSPATNTPALSDATGIKGYYYVCSDNAVINLGSGNIDFKTGDWAIHNGTIYQKIDNTDAVTSVNGLFGAVILDTSNISENTNLYFTQARVLASVLTGYVSGAGTILATDTILQAIQKLNGNLDLKENAITAGTTAQYFRGDKTFQTLDKTAVGLSNVDNTSDASKPISTATQTALDLKENALTTIINESTTARTLVLTDAFKYIRTTNGSATVITIPTNASVPFAIGTQIDCMQIGAGALSFFPNATVNSFSLSVSARYKAATLVKIGTDEWDLIIG